MEKTQENNIVTISGRVDERPELAYEVFGKKVYLFQLASKRKSGVEDIIPVRVSDDMINIEEAVPGTALSIEGVFNSYNFRVDDEKTRLLLSVYAKSIGFISENHSEDLNQITLEGYLCRPPVYRKTPKGKDITDILIAVNRSSRKSDYIPCIVWYDNANMAADFSVGDKVRLAGRIQSRKYLKKNGESHEIRRAIEVSGRNIEKII